MVKPTTGGAGLGDSNPLIFLPGFGYQEDIKMYPWNHKPDSSGSWGGRMPCMVIVILSAAILIIRTIFKKPIRDLYCLLLCRTLFTQTRYYR